MYGSWDIKHNRQNHFGPIFPLPPPNNPQTQNFEKIKKTPEDILQMYTINDSHMMYGSWDMERDRQNLLFCTIFCPFTPLKTWKIKILKKWKKKPWRCYHFTNVYPKWQSYDVWLLRYGAWQTELFVILDHFFPFTPLKIQNIKFWKNEKRPGDIIILHKCTKNHDHMLYCSWDIACDRCNYFSLWAIFNPFISLTAQNSEIKKKKCLKI